MNILILVDDPSAFELDTASIQAAIEAVKRRYAVPSATGLTVTVTTSETVAQLNAQHRGQNKPTDVLSFANEPDPDFPDLEGNLAGYLGDLVIAYPIAQLQAEAAGHRPQDEVILLAVHGTLHILGFDHDTPERKAEMWAAQANVLADLGLRHVQPTET